MSGSADTRPRCTTSCTDTVPLDANFVALIEFPSGDAVRAFAEDPHYAPFAAARRRGSDSRFHLIDSTDLAGTISYLPKG